MFLYAALVALAGICYKTKDRTHNLFYLMAYLVVMFMLQVFNSPIFFGLLIVIFYMARSRFNMLNGIVRPLELKGYSLILFLLINFALASKWIAMLEAQTEIYYLIAVLFSVAMLNLIILNHIRIYEMKKARHEYVKSKA